MNGEEDSTFFHQDTFAKYFLINEDIELNVQNFSTFHCNFEYLLIKAREVFILFKFLLNLLSLQLLSWRGKDIIIFGNIFSI